MELAVQERPDRPAVEAGTAFDGGTFREAMFGAARAQAEAANTINMRPYWVRHLRGNVVECQFEALAADSLACATDHPPPEGCRVAVMPLEEWRDKCRIEQDARGDINEAGWAEVERELGIDRRNLSRALDQRAPSRGFA